MPSSAWRSPTAILMVSLSNHGYRRIGALLRREGWVANHKRVLRVMAEDNLLCLRRRPFVPKTTDSRHGWRVVAFGATAMLLAG
jgi:putative transposase